MVVEVAAEPLERSEPRLTTLVAIVAAFAALGYVLRFLAYQQAVWNADIWNFPHGFCRWDCVWYVRLAQTGYDPFPVPHGIDAGNWAFFPLFPMIVGALYKLTGWPPIDIAVAVSILLSGLAALVAWPLLKHNLRAFTLYAAFLLCGPFSMYFTSFFTEVLFVLLTNCVMLAARRSNYLTAGTGAALLSATRIVGVFGVFIVAVQFLVDYARRGGSVAGLPRELWRRPDIVLAVLIAPLGAFAYMLFLHFYMGDALAFQHVQRAWGRVVGNPFDYLWLALTEPPRNGGWLSSGQWLALSAIGGLVATAVLAWKRHYAEAVFCLLCIVVPMAAGMASMLRFVAALSPIVLLAAGYLARWWPLFLATLLVLVATDYFFALGWIEGWLALV